MPRSTNTHPLLGNDLLLRAAWRRLARWYESAEWRPEPQLSEYGLDPARHLRRLGASLANGEFRPPPFRLLPYPKDSVKLRHYCAPDVDSQITFLALGILLAPLIELAIPSFVFGNRWHRSARRARTAEGAHWQEAPFAFDSGAIYMPYARDYGLYRRVAHWSASAMVGANPADVERPGSASRREDFSKQRVPDFCDRSWWPGEPTLGFWARLDLRLAYPSVVIDQLERVLLQIVERPSPEELDQALFAYPRDIRDFMNEESERTHLVGVLCNLLRSVRYAGGPIKDIHWVPEERPDGWRLPFGDGQAHPGIPTGLAVSGLLFNAYLNDIDRTIADAITRSSTTVGTAFAFMRFADDMAVLSPSRGGLLGALDDINDALVVAPMNLHLNFKKVRPESLARCLKPRTRLRPRFSTQAKSIEDCAWRDAELRQDRVSPFVTHLVETMSLLGNLHLTGRFGARAADRVQDLHELIHLRIDDDEVREDTRLAFAANRLSSAFLPNEGSTEDEVEIARIRQSVAEALERAPAKFSLWRSVLRAACRRPFGPDRDHGAAATWLSSVLRRVSLSAGLRWFAIATRDPDACCDEDEPKKRMGESPSERSSRELALSFLRATFWRELSETLRDLREVPHLQHGDDQKRWRTSSWTFRAVDEDGAVTVAQWLAELERWANDLYASSSPDPSWWWEVDGVLLAGLSSASPLNLLRAVTTDGARTLSHLAAPLPITAALDRIIKAARRFLAQPDLAELAPATALAIASLMSQVQDPQTKSELLRHIRRLDSRTAIRAAQRFGVLAEFTSMRKAQPAKGARKRSRDVWDLEAQAALRPSMLGRTVRVFDPSVPAMLHDVLWAVGSGDALLVQPAAAPAVGLPVKLALRMLCDAMAAIRTEKNGDQVWWTIVDGPLLAETRVARLNGKTSRRRKLTVPTVKLTSKPNLTPHPAFAIAERWGVAPGTLASRAWHQLLQFYVAVDGSERLLDGFVFAVQRVLPLEENWRLRSRVPLPTEVWKAIDALFHSIRDTPGFDLLIDIAVSAVITHAEEYLTPLTTEEFDWNRTDVELEITGGPLDVPMGNGAMTSVPRFFPSRDRLAEQLTVRIAQTTNEPSWSDYYKDFVAGGEPPRIARRARQKIMTQIYEAFMNTTPGSDHVANGPIVFPEVAVPQEEVDTLQALAAFHERSVLTGLLWREARMATGRHPRVGFSTRYLVNEAILCVPVYAPLDPIPVVRTFTVTKPVPAHMEDALCTAVSTKHRQWRMLDGQDWYRFVHPTWGDFTIAICSDLTDPAPWASMSGGVLHLFLVSYNEDVDLFEQMTWVRAFELHCNVVATNHGAHGGSFVWTPRTEHAKEVARLRGKKLFLLADVRLPVLELEDNQRQGVARAVSHGVSKWREVKVDRPKFKAPRPRYPGRR